MAVIFAILDIYKLGESQILSKYFQQTAVTPTLSSANLTQDEYAQFYKIGQSYLNGNPQYKCPDAKTFYSWKLQFYKEHPEVSIKEFSQRSNYLMQQSNYPYWVCGTVFMKTYADQLGQYLQQYTPTSIPIQINREYVPIIIIPVAPSKVPFVQYHSVCQNKACVSVEGSGNNECNKEEDCYHYACSDKQCVSVVGKGSNGCDPLHFGTTGAESHNSDCAHTACQNNACVVVAGGTGLQNECYWDSECSHSECQNGACVKVSGKSSLYGGCSFDSDCKHSECQSGKCVQLNTPGISNCFSDILCQ